MTVITSVISLGGGGGEGVYFSLTVQLIRSLSLTLGQTLGQSPPSLSFPLALSYITASRDMSRLIYLSAVISQVLARPCTNHMLMASEMTVFAPCATE